MTKKVIIGVYDKKADDVIVCNVFPNKDVGLREMFRACWRADYKECNYIDDYDFLCLYDGEHLCDEHIAFRDVAIRYGVIANG